MTEGTRQFRRVAQVIVGKNGQGVSITDLRVVFEVNKTIKGTPNTAVIKIYNLAPDNVAKVKNEYDELLLNAGYEGAVELTFRGNIKHAWHYKEGADWISEIEAADGDRDFRTAVVNETLAAGTTTEQLVQRLAGSFGGTARGEVQVQQRARIRGKVISGNTRDVLDTVAREHGANWSIQDGVFMMIGANAVKQGTAIVLTSETGLLSAPEVNDKGIAARCLMNPKIGINGALKLDNNSIKAKRQAVEPTGKAPRKEKAPVRLDPDGIYKVIKLTHKGDTRGADWYTDAVCVGLDQPIPADTTTEETVDDE